MIVHRIILTTAITLSVIPFAVADAEVSQSATITSSVANEPEASEVDSRVTCLRHDLKADRLWLINTRSLSSDTCRVNLDCPSFSICRLNACGTTQQSTLNDFLDNRSEARPMVIQIHGNRMTDESAIERGLFIYRYVTPHIGPQPIDYVVFSWPSDRVGILGIDAREKAERSDAEGLYLAWLLRELAQRDQKVALIGFSFGGRVATGALHALAGGRLGGRSLPGEHHRGANVAVGLIAPALEDDWLRSDSYHGLATQNISRISVLYNRRDAVLKRYWLIDAARGNMALGYTGPRGLGPRVDGSSVPLVSRDCSPTLGIRHDEMKYYTEGCNAGLQMARLVHAEH